MKQRRRIYYNAQQRWDRYQQGDTLHDIARMFDRYHSSIQGIFIKTGGIRPVERKRSASHLYLNERAEISRGLDSQSSIREIANKLSRAPSTISREINRNGRIHRYRDKGTTNSKFADLFEQLPTRTKRQIIFNSIYIQHLNYPDAPEHWRAKSNSQPIRYV